MTTTYPDFQEWQPSPSLNLLSSDEDDNTRIEKDGPEVPESEQNCIPESDDDKSRIPDSADYLDLEMAD